MASYSFSLGDREKRSAEYLGGSDYDGGEYWANWTIIGADDPHAYDDLPRRSPILAGAAGVGSAGDEAEEPPGDKWWPNTTTIRANAEAVLTNLTSAFAEDGSDSSPVIVASGAGNSTATWDNLSKGDGIAAEDLAWPPDALSPGRSALGALLLLFSAVTVLGNALVVAAVARERSLHTPTHLFVLSLAVADGLVGLLVMPPGATTEALAGAWPFGADACDAWRSLDVLLSTASILNLCVVSLDRYWAIRDPLAYPARMGRPRAAVLVAGVWLCSAAISFPAIAWWRAVRGDEEAPPWTCPFTDHAAYLIVSSAVSFYLPLLVMAFTYCKIYRAAVVQTRSLRLGTKQVASGAPHGSGSCGAGGGGSGSSGSYVAQQFGGGDVELTLRIHRGGGNCSTRRQLLHQNADGGEGGSGGGGGLFRRPTTTSRRCGGGGGKNNLSLSRRLARFAKEKKAAKTLGIVMGVFIVCWLPFFVVNLLSALCPKCLLPHGQLIGDIVTWLGWINSSMNPVIYACWSRDFRRAFARILCVCCRRRRRRRHRPTMRAKPSQYLAASTVLTPSSHSSSNRVGYSSVNQELYGI
ncbi:dopamine receptor 2-like [Ischnura elegans]|uniref:dopamine receptor 2-like n=1 Tax=Ischnura elegans TaxID=197161 RepID=UPI001ED8B92E|nr:dopamine receptor 2-like [Ischnura elegans]